MNSQSHGFRLHGNSIDIDQHSRVSNTKNHYLHQHSFPTIPTDALEPKQEKKITENCKAIMDRADTIIRNDLQERKKAIVDIAAAIIIKDLEEKKKVRND